MARTVDAMILALAASLAACDPSPESLDWETADTTLSDGSILVQRVSYRSEGLRVFGQICRPVGPGPFPLLVSNHGGFAGIGSGWNAGGCVDGARRGQVVIESSYRGEDGSDGEVEVCLGEVDDVLRMLAIAREKPFVDPDRVMMVGISHGGCITTRAVQRGASVIAAVDVFGPTDFVALHGFLRERIDSGSPYSADYQGLLSLIETSTGGTPDEAPEAYAARSPASFVPELEASGTPFLVVHGALDAVVPVDQSCRLAARGTFASYHLDDAQQETQTPPAGCESSGVTWIAGPRPATTWPGPRYAVVYDGVGHDFAGAGGTAMLTDALAFLLAKLP